MGKIYLTSSQLHINIHAETHIQTQSSAFSLGFSLPSIIRPGFLPIGKHPFFLHCLRLSAILCGPRLNSARGQEYPHMAHLNGTGHIDHRHPALKIQRGSATAPLIHSLALTRPRNQQRERNTRAREAASARRDATLNSRCGKTTAVSDGTNFRSQVPDKWRQISARRQKLLPAAAEYSALVVAWEKFIRSHKDVSAK